MRRGLLHCHTYHSFDCLVPPEAYLLYADRARLDFLCITDHNTIAGSVQAARRNRNPRLNVVIGAEYATDRGDIIGLFLTREIRSRRWNEVVAAIQDQGGLVLLPHPYKGHQLDEDLWQAMDMVETFNARTDAKSNQMAFESARAYGKTEYAGGDIHTLGELLTNGTLTYLEGEGDLRTALLDGPRTLARKSAPRLAHKYSQVIKRARRLAGLPGAH